MIQDITVGVATVHAQEQQRQRGGTRHHAQDESSDAHANQIPLFRHRRRFDVVVGNGNDRAIV